MAKILFTADYHIKLGQKNIPEKWAINRYINFFNQIHEIEKSVDLHIIGGDLFDRTPTMAELELYFLFIKGINKKTLIFPGNHEAIKKHSSFLSYLKSATTSINPLVEIIDETTYTGLYTILPYCDLHKKDIFDPLTKEKPLFTHVRGEIPPHVKPEIDLELLADFPIVFAGDLHSHSNCQGNIVYPGSPMTTSFHRTEVETGYIIIDDTDWSWEWKPFKLPQLIRKTVTSEEDMIPTDYHHTIYEIEGDLQKLASVANSDLLDKKVVKRNSEATLILDNDMSIEDELAEYLLYILEIPEDQVASIIGTYHDYSRETT